MTAQDSRQGAARQGSANQVAARNIAAAQRGDAPVPFAHVSRGQFS